MRPTKEPPALVEARNVERLSAHGAAGLNRTEGSKLSETIAVAIICKTPTPGQSKTRLSPPFRPDECAGISACFIQDLANTIEGLSHPAALGYAVYTPVGSEHALRRLIPENFGLMPQSDGDLGDRLRQGIDDLLEAGHRGAILINSDSPTLPPEILRAAVEVLSTNALSGRDQMVICPALDGGYTLIGLSRPHPRLFEDIVWSTMTVFERTIERAREIDLPVVVLPAWYDIDDAGSYAMLEAELDGRHPDFADSGIPLHDAPHTRAFIESRRAVTAL